MRYSKSVVFPGRLQREFGLFCNHNVNWIIQDQQLLEMEIPEEGAQAQQPQEEGQGNEDQVKETDQSKREAPNKNKKRE